ncbi:MAG: hypothetical protein FWF54_10630 [Candidatus Azobacteroides sp.]|nr:hypothetical protein [Candidatus Azobacteroides sp.]
MKKILLYIGYMAAIITIIYGIIDAIKNQRYLLSIVTNVWTWVVIVFIILAIILYGLYKHIYRLNKRIQQLENEGIIPIIEGNFMGGIHKKQERSKYINNNMSITLLEKITEISGFDECKASKTIMRIHGILSRDSDNFKFIISNDSISHSRSDKIDITAKDISDSTPTPLNISTSDESNNKEYTVSYEKRKTAGSLIALEISWTWPKMFDIDGGYVTLSTCYSKTTKKIKHTFIPHKEQTFDEISLWQYKISKTPSFLRKIAKEKDIFSYEIENPDEMTDYIIIYKNLQHLIN